jgi:hypothetical protein
MQAGEAFACLSAVIEYILIRVNPLFGGFPWINANFCIHCVSMNGWNSSFSLGLRVCLNDAAPCMAEPLTLTLMLLIA